MTAVAPIMMLGAFSPLSIQGCALWLEADRGITLDGSNNVSAWADQSGNGRHASQTTPSLRFDYIVSGQNGRPCLYSDGIGRYMSLVPFSQTQSCTIFLVAKCSDGAIAYRSVLERSTGYTITWENGKPKTYPGASSPTTNYNFGVFRFRWTSSQTAQATNGNTEITSATTTTPGTWTNISHPGGWYWKGYLAAIVIYARTLSVSEYQCFERAYGAKYGITVA